MPFTLADFAPLDEGPTTEIIEEAPEVRVPKVGFKIPEDTLAFRNNNPGNLRFAGQEGAEEGEGGFAKFKDPEAGFGALKRQVELDAGRGHTLDSFINKYAPPVENDTQRYITNIENFTGKERGTKLSDMDMDVLARAMARQESGAAFDEDGEEEVEEPQKVSGLTLADFAPLEEAPKVPVTTTAPVPQRMGAIESIKDVTLGTVETASGLLWGAASWLPAQAVRHGFTLGQIAQQNLGIVPEMSPEEIARTGNEIAENIQTLGGLTEPQTISGKASLDLVGKAIEPITKLAGWLSSGADPETHPNLHNLTATGYEGLMFAFLPKAGKRVKAIVSKGKKIGKLKGEAKAKAIEDLEADRTAFLDKVEEQLKNPENLEKASKKLEKQAVISGQRDFATQLKENRKAVQRQRELQAGLEKGRIAAKEAPPVVEPAPPARELPKKGAPAKTAKQILAERARERGVERIERAPKQISVLRVETPKEKRIFAKKQVANYISATGKSPGRHLVDTILKPLRDETGAITFHRKEIKQRLTETQQETIRRIGKAAEATKLPFDDFLKTLKMTPKEVEQMKSLHDQMRVERPHRSAMPMEKLEFGIEKPEELYTLREGEIGTNPSRVKKGKVAVGERWLSAAKEATRSRTPWLLKTFKTPLTKFTELGGPFKEIWHRSRDARRFEFEERKIVEKHVEDLHGDFSNKKLREEAGAVALSQTKNGTEAMKTMGVEVKKGPIEYQRLLDTLEPLYEDLHTRLNETRAAIGRKPIPKMEKYAPFFAQENFYDSIGQIFKGEKLTRSPVNLVTDGLDAIAHRHKPSTVDATHFAHLKRGKLRRGTKLELDPLKQYARYSNNAIRHIHTSPINAFIKEFTTKNMIDPKTGKSYNMSMHNPELAEFLGAWSNHIAGVPNVLLPKKLSKGIRKMSSNFTAAVLGWSARTVLVQPSSLLATGVEFGIPQTMKGLADTISRKKVPIDKSRELGPRVHDAFLMDTVDKLSAPGVTKPWRMFKAGALKGMSYVDYIAAEATWRTAYNSIKKSKKGVSDLEAIRFADDAVIRTQGAGDPGAVSPAQMNALGRAATLWQTFTINQANFIAKEVLGIKNPDLNNAKVMGRVAKYVVGAGLINMLFQEGMGMQGPFPSPINAIIEGLEKGDSNAIIALDTMMELSEALPLGSSIKFGSHPLGPHAEYIGNLSALISGNDQIKGSVIPRALEGDKRAMLQLAEFLGQGLGVPGTRQASKYVKARGRGENVLGAVVGRFEPKVGKKKRRKRRKRKRRR